MNNKEEIRCIHCNEPMKMWQTPSFGFAGSTGFGYPYLWVCFNDKCHFYVQGWEHTRKTFGRKASYRFATYPDNDCNIAIPVFTEVAGKGNIIENPSDIYITEELAAAKLKFYELITAEDNQEMARFLCNEETPKQARIEAAQHIGNNADLDMLEYLYDCVKVRDLDISTSIAEAVAQIHNRHFTKCCVYCAEIIKARATICKFCNKELPDEQI